MCIRDSLGRNQNDVFEKIYENIYYILSLGGERAVSFGSDFDGASMSKALGEASKVIGLYDFLKAKGFSENLLYSIFYGNAYKFFYENK